MYQSLLLLKVCGPCLPRTYIQDGRNKHQVMIKVSVSLAVYDLWRLSLNSLLFSFFAFSLSLARFHMCLSIFYLYHFPHLKIHYLKILKKQASFFLNYNWFNINEFTKQKQIHRHRKQASFLKKHLIILFGIESLAPGTLQCSRNDVPMSKTMQIWRKHVFY